MQGQQSAVSLQQFNQAGDWDTFCYCLIAFWYFSAVFSLGITQSSSLQNKPFILRKIPSRLCVAMQIEHTSSIFNQEQIILLGEKLWKSNCVCAVVTLT